MTWYPKAIQKPVPRFNTGGAKAQLRSRGRGVCNHVAVSEASTLFTYFNTSGNPCSHFYVRKTGVVEQYMSIDYRAPCQLEGNWSLISIETQGGVYNLNTEPWIDVQVDAIVELHLWLHEKDGFPIQLMTDSKSTTKGIGWHLLGCEPNVVEGGELWSEAYGKECPGAKKIEQVKTVIYPRVKAGGDMLFTDTVPGAAKDPDGTVLTVVEALLRGARSYTYVIEGGPLEDRVSVLEVSVKNLLTKLGQNDARLIGVADDLATLTSNFDAHVAASGDPVALTERVAALEAVLVKIKTAL